MASDSESLAREMVRRLARLAAGPAADAMRRRGLDYRVIFGVQLPALEAAVRDFRGGCASAEEAHGVALALAARPEREARLAALILADPERVLEEGAAGWGRWICGPETAEAFARHVLGRCAGWEREALVAAGGGRGDLCAYAAFLGAASAAAAGRPLDAERWTAEARRAADGGGLPARAAETLIINIEWMPQYGKKSGG